jgi:hypothetical protein
MRSAPPSPTAALILRTDISAEAVYLTSAAYEALTAGVPAGNIRSELRLRAHRAAASGLSSGIGAWCAITPGGTEYVALAAFTGYGNVIITLWSEVREPVLAEQAAYVAAMAGNGWMHESI